MEAGRVVFRSKAFVRRLSRGWSGVQCWGCAFVSGKLRCTRCKVARYCSGTCQRLHWGHMHKATCRFLGEWNALVEGYPEAAVDDVETVLWVIIKLNEKVETNDTLDSIDAFVNASAVRNMSVCSDEQLVQSPHYLQLIPLIKQGITLYQRKYSDSGINMTDMDILRLLGKMDANNFSIWNDMLTSYGIGVYPLGALLNHSCDPNCVIMYEGPEQTQVIRTIRKVAAGEELCHSYLDLAMDRTQRQEYLQSRYSFTCLCRRCEGHVRRDVECYFSKIEGSEDKARKAISLYESGYEMLEGATDEAALWKAAEILNLALKECKACLHPGNLKLLAVRCALHRSLVELMMPVLCIPLCKNIVRTYRRIYPENHPLVGLQLYTLASELLDSRNPSSLDEERLRKLTFKVDDGDDWMLHEAHEEPQAENTNNIRAILQSSLSCLRITHGREHRLCIEIEGLMQSLA